MSAPEHSTDYHEGRELADELIRWARHLHIALPQSLYDRARRLIGELPSQEPVACRVTNFGSVSDLLSDEEREESLRTRVTELSEAEIREGSIIVDLEEFRFLLRLLDEARAERDAMERDFVAEGLSAYDAGKRFGYEEAVRAERPASVPEC